MKQILLVSAVALVVGCSGEPVGQSPGGGAEVTPEVSLARLRQEMAAIGCHSAAPKSGQSEVTVPLPDGASATFECSGVSRADIRRAVLRHRSATAGSPNSPLLAAALSNAGSVRYHLQCWVTNYWNYDPVFGEYVFAYRTIDSCWYTEIYVDGGGGGGGGGGGTGTWHDQDGNPVPPPSEPIQTTPALVSDTCRIVTGDRVVRRVINGEVISFDGTLNEGAIQDSMRAAHFNSYGVIGNTLPLSERLELGGLFGFNAGTQAYEFRRLPGASTRCSYKPDPFSFKSFPGLVVLGFWHTHPMRDGELYTCPTTGDTVWQADAEGHGGGSGADWATADTLGVPVYTIDPDRIWRLEPNTPPGWARQTNPQRWMKGTSGQCADVAAF